MKETDLYSSVADYLEHQGYQVNSEVKHCDITALKGDDLIIVELKTRFSLALVYQALERKKLTPSVYVAIPVTSAKPTPPNYKSVKSLLRKLEVGLILVRFLKNKKRVEVVLHPTAYEQKKSPKRRKSIIREIEGRYGEFNQGGSDNSVEKITTYKQEAIRIAWFLREGDLTPKELRERGCGAKTQQILAANFYGWFNRVKRGLYSLDPAGLEALESYKEITASI